MIIGDLKLGPEAEAEAVLAAYPHPPVSAADGGKPSALFHKTDVVSWPQLSSLWKTALEAFPTVDVVVSGAGLYDPPWSSFWAAPRTPTNPDSASRDAADAEPGHYAVLDVNLVAPIRMSQLAIGHWTTAKQRGCLVHAGSVAGYLAEAASPFYFASKHGLHGFVRSLADLRDELGIRVSCVAPGPAKVPSPIPPHPRTPCSATESLMCGQTGIWYQDASRAEEILVDCRWVTVEEIVQAMYQLVVNEQYGNGTILEVTPGETRVVPMFNAPPPKPGAVSMPAMGAFHEKLFEDLKMKGLRV